jgi:hypothetical protein
MSYLWWQRQSAFEFWDIFGEWFQPSGSLALGALPPFEHYIRPPMSLKD